MKFCRNLSDFYNNYDYFILDLWGVIHDGANVYEGVINSLEFLKSNGKNVCFLSNAPRRAKKAIEVLDNLGVSKDLYQFILTSGEASFIDFKKNQENNFNNWGKKYFYIGPKKDIDLLEGLEYKLVQNASEADFAIATGFNNVDSVLEEKLPEIKQARQYNLPLICINPDFLVVKQNGSEMICAGILAKEYQKMQGDVFYYGKPFSAVYEMVYRNFNCPDKKRIIAIGDGIETDIKGAKDFGIDSALVTGGILCNELGIRYGEEANRDKVEKICQSHDIFPEYIIPKL